MSQNPSKGSHTIDATTNEGPVESPQKQFEKTIVNEADESAEIETVTDQNYSHYNKFDVMLPVLIVHI